MSWSADSWKVDNSAASSEICDRAMKLQIAGDLDRAAELYGAILQAHPTHPVANHCLGMLHVQRRQPAEGLNFLLIALKAHPEVPEYWLGYLEALLQAGQFEAATSALALGRHQSLSGPAVEIFAARLAATGFVSTIVPSPEIVPPRTTAMPPRAETGGAHLRPPRAREMRPRRPKASRPHKESRRLRERIDALTALVAQNRPAEALPLARALVRRFPEEGLGWKYLGGLLYAQGLIDEGLVAMAASVRLLPQDAEAHCNLGIALEAVKRFTEAATALRRALEIDPTYAAAHYRLAMDSERRGEYAEATARLRTALALEPRSLSVDHEQGFSNHLHLLAYDAEIDADSLFAEHCRFGETFEAPLRGAWPQHVNAQDPERILRVGFVSGDLRDHSVGMFLEPIVARLARRPGLELHAYQNSTAEDFVTARLRRHFEHWHPIAGLSQDALATRVMDDGIDILVDLYGHTGLNRLPAFARKPAPIQVSWLGSPGTTGLQSMDYYLADRHWLPLKEFDRLFTEKLVYLPDRWAYETHPDAPAVNALPALASGRLTFGSFHRAGKINACTVRLWSELLLAVPDSTLLLTGIAAGDQQRTLCERFQTHGVEPSRLRFHDRCSMGRYLALHHEVDIALDAYPYAGGTTTMHSLSMGVPTLTLAGTTAAGHAGAGILAQIGLEGFTATSDADFIDKGRFWANHLPALAGLRAGLRLRLQESPGGQPDLIAAHVEGALRLMWRRWCAGLPVESFQSAAPETASEPTQGNLKPQAPLSATQTTVSSAANSVIQSSAIPLARHPAARSASQEDDALLTLMTQRRFTEALAQARSMTVRFPEHGLGWKIFGALSWSLENADEALAAMQRSIQLLPHDPEALTNLGVSLTKLKRYEEAEIAFRHAVALDPAYAGAHYRLGMAYELQGRYDAAGASLRTAESLRSEADHSVDQQGHSNLLYLMGYNAEIDADALYAEHLRFGERIETPLRSAWPRHSHEQDPERRLRIGFISGDLVDHAVAMFLTPIAAVLADSASLELHAYSNRAAEDQFTARLRGHFKHWHPIFALSDLEAATQIAADGIDILIDLSGHTGLNRLTLLARKPAPIQAGWLGYPGTTGLQSMDYYFADHHWLPPGEFARLFTEKLVYLPDRWAFEPHPDAPAVNSLPALKAGHLTFGSFHRFGKINAATVQMWSDLLLALPESSLLIAGFSSDSQQRALLTQFAGYGVAPERLKFCERCTMDVYLALHHQVDIALDARPYAGGTTTMHSLSMGVPTLTVAGTTAAGRAGAGILAQAGIEGFTATDHTDFVTKGVHWSNHLLELARLRATLRTRLTLAPGGQRGLIAAHFEASLRHMWHRWCAGLPAKSFRSEVKTPDR